VIKRRREIASMYNEQLSVLEEVKLPPAPMENGDHYDVYQNYELQAENRDALKNYLANNGVGTIIQWAGKAVHQWEVLGFDIKLPKTESFFEKCLMLPMNMFISNLDIDYVCDSIISFYRK
jgi:dTDP-4-amino-4,6-dideoxygalactose transaminase